MCYHIYRLTSIYYYCLGIIEVFKKNVFEDIHQGLKIIVKDKTLYPKNIDDYSLQYTIF